MKYSTACFSASFPSLSKNSREVQDAREGLGDWAGCSGRRAEGVYAGALGATAPAVYLKVRVAGGIEGLQGELSHSALGPWWSLGKPSGLRLRVTLTQYIC